MKTSRGLERENTGGNCEEGGWDAYVIDLASFKRGPEGFLDTCSQRHVASVDTASDWGVGSNSLSQAWLDVLACDQDVHIFQLDD